MAEQIPGGAEGPNNWQVIGISRDQWRLIGAALALGGNVRAGLEDNLYLPDGEMAKSNGELIAKARQMAEDVGRRAATVAEARELLGVRSARRPRRVSWRRAAFRASASATSGSSTSPGCCRAASARCCSPTSGPTWSRSRTPGMGDYVRWAPPFYGSDSRAGAGDALGPLPVAQPRQARDQGRPKVRGRARGPLAARRRLRRRARALPPRRPRQARLRLRRPARGQPPDRLLRHHRLRADGPQHPARRARHELPRPHRAAGPHWRAPAAGRSSRPVRSPTSAAAG